VAGSYYLIGFRQAAGDESVCGRTVNSRKFIAVIYLIQKPPFQFTVTLPQPEDPSQVDVLPRLYREILYELILRMHAVSISRSRLELCWKSYDVGIGCQR
jgi:hypothetical protein